MYLIVFKSQAKFKKFNVENNLSYITQDKTTSDSLRVNSVIIPRSKNKTGRKAKVREEARESHEKLGLEC